MVNLNILNPSSDIHVRLLSVVACQQRELHKDLTCRVLAVQQSIALIVEGRDSAHP